MCLHLQELGPLSPHEVSTLALFLALVLVWLLRRPGFMPGWADTLQWTNEEGEITNTALLACLITDELLTITSILRIYNLHLLCDSNPSHRGSVLHHPRGSSE